MVGRGHARDHSQEGSLSTLDEAERAFERGDFARARRIAGELAAGSDEPTRQAARALLERTAVDPLIVWLTVGCVALFVLIVALSLR
jgi:hypothetical protein